MSAILILTMLLLLLLLLLHLPCTLGASIPSSSGDISGGLHRRRHWRVLHQPFFPADVPPPPQAPPPSAFSALPPQPQQPKLPSSNVPSSGSGSGSGRRPFFPSDSPPKPPPPPSPKGTTAAAFPNVVNTFPANISSLTLPQSPSRKPFSPKLVVIAAAVLSISVASVLVLFLYHRRHRDFAAAAAATCKPPGSDSLRLYPADAATSDGGCGSKSVGGSGTNSTEFPFPGGGVGDLGGSVGGIAAVQSVSVHQKMGSPELRPLPPLPRLNLWREKPKTEPWNDREGDEEDDFFSPRGSLGGKGSNSSSSPNPNPHPHPERAIGGAAVAGNFGSRSSNSYPDLISTSPSPPERASPERVSSGSPVLTKLPPPRIVETPFVAPAESWDSISVPPPPPPPKPIAPKPASSVEGSEDATKPKLKPLHWDKVRASSECAMVWDHLESSSFQLNEEMIETLFVVNGSNLNRKEIHRWPGMPPAATDQENQVLDPKKSQNIAILLRALNVTIEEVCEALLQGHTDTLGAELLESLLRMAPTKEEECKLKEYNDQSPFKLGPAEKFLKAVIHIPFAFKRVDAMLYIANFDSDVEYLKRSFETLEAACEELRNSRMFLKLLEAVLKTGNRMNVGTNRGDALAFKLDTLLKLVDVKGTDGKTTLLHFVVHEISRAEGSRLSGANYDQNHNRTPESDIRDDIEFRKLGLQVVSSLSGELSSVKKAANMDFDVLSSDVAKLARGVTKIREVAKLDEELALRESSRCFLESMNGFLKKAEEEITRMQAQETITLSMVKEITEYFHGNSAKEEAHRCRIFLVVRDFLLILDNVCKDVGKMNERTIVSSGRQIPQLINPAMLPDFHGLDGRQQCGSLDDQNSPSS